jgi:hypothetical protein
MSTTLDGPALVAGILARKAALEAYVAAEDAWRLALQAAVANHGDWGHVRQAGEIVKQAQAALDRASA